MKKIFFFSLVFIAALFYSCDKEESNKGEILKSNPDLETRVIDCKTCEGITFNPNLMKVSSKDANGCCKFRLFWQKNGSCSNTLQEIYVDGVFFGRLNQFPSGYADIPVCTSNSVIKVMGYNPATGLWDAECFNKVASCVDCNGCEALTNVVISKTGGQNASGCCTYKVSWKMNEYCNYDAPIHFIILNGAKISPITSAATEYTFTSCDQNANIQVVVQNLDGSLTTCTSQNFKCTCCDNVSLVSTTIFVDPVTKCCKQEVKLVNNSTCPVTLSANGYPGIPSAIVQPGSTYTKVYNFCQGQVPINFSAVLNDGTVCKQITVGPCLIKEDDGGGK